MRKFVFGTIGIVAASFAAPALAADMAVKAAPVPYIAPVYNWSGFYIGGNGGWGQSRDCRSNVTLALNLGCFDADGAVVGGQVGYRWQTGGWVFGLEAQGDWADLTGSTQNLGNPINRIHSKMDAFGLFTGQVGYAWNNALFYVKGGAAITSTSYDFIFNATNLTGASFKDDNRWSPTVGVGFEYGFAPNWSFGVEYDHIFSGRRDVRFVTPAGVILADTYNTGGDTDLVMGRINYRFGWGGGVPVAAKY